MGVSSHFCHLYVFKHDLKRIEHLLTLHYLYCPSIHAPQSLSSQYPSNVDLKSTLLGLVLLGRIVGSILHIVAEKTNPPQIGLYIGAYTLEGIGLTPFLFCTKAFIGVM